MGTHPIFESDFDCLTDTYTHTNGRQRTGSGVDDVSSAAAETNSRIQRQCQKRAPRGRGRQVPVDRLPARLGLHQRVLEPARPVTRFLSWPLKSSFGSGRLTMWQVPRQWPGDAHGLQGGRWVGPLGPNQEDCPLARLLQLRLSQSRWGDCNLEFEQVNRSEKRQLEQNYIYFIT